VDAASLEEEQFIRRQKLVAGVLGLMSNLYVYIDKKAAIGVIGDSNLKAIEPKRFLISSIVSQLILFNLLGWLFVS